MIAKRLTQLAEVSAMRYAGLCQLWQGVFDRALTDKNFGYADHPSNVARECYVLAETFLTDEREHIDRMLEEIASDAHQTTLSQIASADSDGLEDAALDHLAQTAHYLADELIAQIHRDIAMVRQAIQRIQLEVYTAARAKRISERQALIEYSISNRETLQFMFHDRYARKWSSKKFVRALWRHTLLAAYNETVMLTLADHGIETAAVVSDQSDHAATISLTGALNMMSYADSRAEYFHPNSNAYLSMEPR